jgi:hypothetical protein
MGTVEFQGDPPYDLPVAQTAEALAEGENVELTLRVSLPGKLPSPAPIRVQMTAAVARAVGGQMGAAATAAEMRARRQGR